MTIDKWSASLFSSFVEYIKLTKLTTLGSLAVLPRLIEHGFTFCQSYMITHQRNNCTEFTEVYKVA